MTDAKISTNAQASTLIIHAEPNGSWSVRSQDGSRGGFFVSYEAARRFVDIENVRHQQRGST